MNKVKGKHDYSLRNESYINRKNNLYENELISVEIIIN